MQDLVESVKINGVLTPVLLRIDENEEYEMVSGHRRMHAAQLAGLTTIPVSYTHLDVYKRQVHTPQSCEVFWHECAKIPRHTSQNSIAAGNLEFWLRY